MITKICVDAQGWVPNNGDIICIHNPEVFPNTEYRRRYRSRPRDEQYVVYDVNPESNTFRIQSKDNSLTSCNTFGYKITRYSRRDVFIIIRHTGMKMLKEALIGKQ